MDYTKSCSFKKLLGIFLWAFLLAGMFLLVSCGKESVSEKKEDIEFPVDDKGYPQNNLVMINDKSYPIDFVGQSQMESEIEVKMDGDRDFVEITLPQGPLINYWSLDEKEYMDLLSYSRIDFPIKDENMVEGPSPAVQKFVLNVTRGESSEILLKWANVDDMDKLFKDKKEDYLLRIKVIY